MGIGYQALELTVQGDTRVASSELAEAITAACTDPSSNRMLKRGNYQNGQQYVILRAGQHLPLLGLGTCIGDHSEVEGAVKHALKVGYR